MIAASLYAACRDTEIPRTLKDVTEVTIRNRYKGIKEMYLSESYL